MIRVIKYTHCVVQITNLIAWYLHPPVCHCAVTMTMKATYTAPMITSTAANDTCQTQCCSI